MNGVENDYAWYACYVPATATSKPIIVVVKVEKGGFGDVAAAPVARQILSQWFYGKPGPFISGQLGHAMSAVTPIQPSRGSVSGRGGAAGAAARPAAAARGAGPVGCSILSLHG